MWATLPLLIKTDFPALLRRNVETLQVNLGYRCHQSCVHCHVNAGPNRTEVMAGDTVDAVIDYLGASPHIALVDLTGGAPELNPHFRRLVIAARSKGVRVIDRCNLTVLEEAGQEDLARFLAGQGVDVVASLPCYLEENVDKQRGTGVFETSLRALHRLNRLGYGQTGSGLTLDLVYNPQGARLPPPQANLQQDYKRHLGERYGIVFNRLLTLANMPIKRFGSTLVSTGRFDDYMNLLRQAHRDENLDQVMCRTLVSVDWRGFLYDCDFNQQLDLPIRGASHARMHIRELSQRRMQGMPIRVADHCFGCTAGQGSSCGGAFEADNAVASAT